MISGRAKAVIGACGLVIAGSFTAFIATGMYPYTRFHDPELAKANEEHGLSDLLADTGAAEGHEELAGIDNVTAFGFLPSGPGMASLSVATTAGPAAGVAAGAFFWSRRRRRCASACCRDGCAPEADSPDT